MNRPRLLQASWLTLLLLSSLAAPALSQTKANPAAPLLRPPTVAPLSGGLDRLLLVNDNNPELIRAPGILLSTFPGAGRGVPAAHLDVALNGRFDLFSHHVYAGKPESLDSTLWLAVLAAPRGPGPVTLKLLAGSTALSQAVDPGQAGAPFLPLPSLMVQGTTPVWAGPGSRVATELLARQRSPRSMYARVAPMVVRRPYAEEEGVDGATRPCATPRHRMLSVAVLKSDFASVGDADDDQADFLVRESEHSSVWRGSQSGL